MTRNIMAAAAAALALLGCATTIDEREFSLLKGSVFDTPQPAAYTFEGAGTGKQIAPLVGSGMPPMITHPVDAYLPITAASNACVSCHAAGATKAAGQPAPLPASHLRSRGNVVGMSNAFNNCMACHAPQSASADLVPNQSPTRAVR